MMKNNVSHADKLLKLIFLDKLDAGSGKSKIQKFISMIIEREYFMKILAKLVKNALKTGFSGFPENLDPRYRILFC